jgi:general secretion pathway protein G
MKRRARRQGFTLMEMLVVLAILVLLVAMVAPRILGTQKKADINAAKTQVGLLKSSLERYALDMKNFPTTEEGLQALLEAPAEEGSEGAEGGATNWDGPYLNSTELPRDPWGNDYQYEYPPTHGTGDYPDIWSYGPDKEDGTEDDIVSWGKSQEEGESGAPSEDGERPASTRSPESP